MKKSKSCLKVLCQGREGRPLRRLEVALAAEMVADHRGHRGDTNGRLGVAVGRLKNRKAGGARTFQRAWQTNVP